MIIRRTARLLTLTAAYTLAATAWAKSGATAAPELAAKPISGLLAIDFRCKISEGFPGPDLEAYPFCNSYKSRDIISVSAIGGTLVQNVDCPDNPSDQGDPTTGYKFLDGYGIVGTRSKSCDDAIDKKERLEVSIASTGDVQAVFDVNGLWLTDFRRNRNGESGVITLTLVDGDTRSFSFNWKDVSSENITLPNYNDEFLVGFGETLRITKADISATPGSFSVAGFAGLSQQPVVINTEDCTTDSENCNPEIARSVRLELKEATGEPGNKGIKGTLVNEGVYVVRDTRPQCQPPGSPGAGYGTDSLPIDITGDKVPDLIMLPHQCGYPAADSPQQGPVIYVLDLDGSDLVIAEDTITAVFDDESNDPRILQPTYFCESHDPAFRPGVGWLPKSGNTAPYAEIPVFDGAGNVVFDLQDNTAGPCGSTRGTTPRYSYVVYNWVNRVDATGTSYDAIISARIEQLAAFVDDLFPCVQKGINQSTLSSDVGRIDKSFADGRYGQTVTIIEEMRLAVLDPRLNDQIGEGGCFFDLAGDVYVGSEPEPNTLVPANAVGNLLVQLKHLDWMVRTTVLGQAPNTEPVQGN